jgi:hypothetical protein
MLIWLWVECYRLVQAAARALIIERERDSCCDTVKRGRECDLPLEPALFFT